MKRRIVSALGCAALVAGLAGCASYHMVTDPTTNKVYYTNDLDRTKMGSVVFTDGATGSQVTLQNSEVQKIKKSLYKAHTP